MSETNVHSSHPNSFLGPITVGKDRVNLGKALVVVEYEKDFPKHATVYFLNRRKRHEREMDVLSAHEFTVHSGSHSLCIEYSKSTNTLSLFGPPEQMKLQVVISRMMLNKTTWLSPKLQTKHQSTATVLAYMTPVCFLEHDVDGFQYNASQNLKRIREISKGYEYRLNNVGGGCLLTPWLVAYQPQVGKTLTLQARNIVVFEKLGGRKPNKIIQRLQPELDGLARIISFLDNYQHDFDHIEINLESRKQIASLWYWRLVKDKVHRCPSVAYDVAEYVCTIEKISESLSNMTQEQRHKIEVAMWRFRMASEAQDLSIRIALYEVVLTVVLSILTNRRMSLYASKKNERLLKSRGFALEPEDITAIKQFHEIRNRVFKDIRPGFEYSSAVIKTMNRATQICARAFAAAFSLDSKGERVIAHAVRAHHHLPE